MCMRGMTDLSCSAVYSFDGIVVSTLLLICTCAYIRRVPKLKEYFLSDKKGFFGTLYKGKAARPCSAFRSIFVMTNIIAQHR